jgi:hypothetical protein
MAKKGEVVIAMKDVVDYSRLMGAFVPTLRGVVERKVTAAAAKEHGLKVTNQELQRGADTFRHATGLSSAKATEAWMSRHGVSLELFEEFLETSILVSKFKDELEQKADKATYLKHPEVARLVRNLAYQEWLAQNLE